MFYVYILKNPKTNIPFYVGKGKGNRCNHHFRENPGSASSYKCKEEIKILKNEGYKKEDILEINSYFEDENEAYQYETELILKYGRIGYEVNGILFNKIIKHDKWKNSWSGKKHKKETIEKMKKPCPKKANYGEKNGFYGKSHTEETIEKLRISSKNYHLGRKRSIETKIKMRGSKSVEHTEKLRLQAEKNRNSYEMKKSIEVKNYNIRKNIILENFDNYKKCIELILGNNKKCNIAKELNISYGRVDLLARNINDYIKIIKDIENDK